jgi:hypothetical protein
MAWDSPALLDRAPPDFEGNQWDRSIAREIGDKPKCSLLIPERYA